jgi:hypothetical protein
MCYSYKTRFIKALSWICILCCLNLFIYGLIAANPIMAEGAPAANLLQNPGFENDLTGWTTGGTIPGWIATDNKHSGIKSFNMWGTGNYTSLLQNTAVNCPGGNYSAKVWLRGGGTYNDVKFQVYQDGVLLKELSITLPDGWSQFTIDNIGVTDGSTVKVGIRVDAVAVTWIYADDFELYQSEPVIEAGSLLNPGFEDGMAAWTAGGTKPGWITADNKHSGSNSFNMWDAASYTSSIQNTVNNCVGGNYTAKVWIKGGGTYNELKLQVFLGDTLLKETDITPTESWTQYVVENVDVPEGADVKIGLWVSAVAVAWLYIDDFEFGRNDSGQEPPDNEIVTTGSNLAYSRPAFASSSERASYGPENAVDGEDWSRWASVSGDPQWIYVDLGKSYAVKQVILKWEAAFGKAYEIQVSEDANGWTTIFTTDTGNGNIDNLDNLSGTGRYVRVFCRERGSEWGYSLWEIGIYDGNYYPDIPQTVPAPGENLLVNPGFEQDMAGWQSSGTGIRVAGDNFHSGKKSINMWDANAYTCRIETSDSTLVRNCTEGTYSVKVWVRGGGTWSKLKFLVYKGDAPVNEIDIAGGPGSDVWKEYIINDISVSEGDSLKVCLDIAADAGAWFYFDDFELKKVGDPQVPQNITVEPNKIVNYGFESDEEGWSKSGSVPGKATTQDKYQGSKAFMMNGSSAYISVLEYEVSGCEGGIYAARTWVRYFNDFNSAKFQVYVDGTLSKEISFIKPQGWWLQYSLNGLDVPEGATVKVRVEVDAKANALFYFDEFELSRMNPAVEPYSPDNAISKLVKRPDGSYYISVDDRPFLYNLVQNPDMNETVAAKIDEANYKAFTVWLNWKDIEPKIGRYDWQTLDNAIDLANKYNMRLDIVWGGSAFCGGIREGSAPGWLVGQHYYHMKSGGKCLEFKEGNRHIADYNNAALLKIESGTVAKLMEHVAEYDKNHRLITFQVENEANPIWQQLDVPKSVILNYMNEIAKVVKMSSYPVITRVNLGYGSTADCSFNTLYIDMNGSDPYVPNISNTANQLDNTLDSRFPHLSENGGYSNSTSHIVTALSRGGGYNMYKVEYDSYWGRPGLYGPNYTYEHHTYEIKNLNAALNKIASFTAESLPSRMAGFNCDTGVNDPVPGVCETKEVSGVKVRFESVENNAPVGMVIVDDKEKYLYCIADNDAIFTVFVQPVLCEVGYMDDTGNWWRDDKTDYLENPDGTYSVQYKATQVLRIKMPGYVTN